MQDLSVKRMDPVFKGEKENTLNAAKRVGIQDVCEIDSMESFGVRIADMLAGIISKLLKAFHNANRTIDFWTACGI